MESHSQLTAVSNDAWLRSLAWVRAVFLHLVQDRERFLSYLAEHTVPAVEPLTFYEAQKDLGALSVGASGGHGEVTFTKVLVVEVLAVYYMHANT